MILRVKLVHYLTTIIPLIPLNTTNISNIPSIPPTKIPILWHHDMGYPILRHPQHPCALSRARACQGQKGRGGGAQNMEAPKMDGGVWGGPQVGGEGTIQGTGEQEDTPLFTHLYCMHAYTTIYGMHTTTPHPPIRAMYGRMGAPQYRVHSTPYSMIWIVCMIVWGLHEHYGYTYQHYYDM